MNKILSRLFVLLIFVLTGCEQKGCAAEVEYEFLTPQVLVIKNPKPYIHTSHKVVKQGLSKKIRVFKDTIYPIQTYLL